MPSILFLKNKRELIKSKSAHLTIYLTSENQLQCFFFDGYIKDGMPTLTEKQL